MISLVLLVASLIWALKFAKRPLDYVFTLGLVVPFFAAPVLVELVWSGLWANLLILTLQLGVSVVAASLGASFRARAMQAVLDEA